jgi:hypothetical protein
MSVISYKAPRFVEYQGIKYKVHDNVQNMLELFLLLEQENDDIERAIIIVTKMFGVDAPVEQVLVNEAIEIYNNGATYSEADSKKKPSTDFIQDYSTYRMDIIREYNGLDIDKDPITWGDLQYYLGNLSADSMLNTKSKIRTQNLKEVDKKHLSEFKKVQKAIAIIDRTNPVVEHEEPKKTIFDIYMRKEKEKYKKEKGG